jgi:hypothetical protein
LRQPQAAAAAAAKRQSPYTTKIFLQSFIKAGRYLPALIFQMKKIALTILVVLVMIQFSLNGHCQKPVDEEDQILVAAESIFKAMKKKDYPKIWALLTNVSKNAIVDDIIKEESKRGGQYSREAVHDDLAAGGGLAKVYWSNYLAVFNPDIVLEQSKWQMGKVARGKAVIVIKYKRSDRPAELQVLKENGAWKVGLDETFRPSRR